MKRVPPKLQPWFEARQKFRLSHTEIQMARELGMNPKNFSKLANVDQQRWKVSLPQFIAHCFRRQFGIDAPAEVRTLEQVVNAAETKRAIKHAKKPERKAQGNEISCAGSSAGKPVVQSHVAKPSIEARDDGIGSPQCASSNYVR